MGQLQTLTDEPSFFTVKAFRDDVNLIESEDEDEITVATLDAKFIRRCMAHYPRIAVSLANSVINELSPYVRSIDFALEWLQLQSGKALYKQGYPADSTYVVLSGRLRSVISKKGKKEMVGEYARGDLTGIVETLMKTPRSTTVLAVRDTEVAKIPAGLLDAIKVRYPVVLHRLIKMLGQKVQQSWEKGSPGSGVSDGMPGQTAGVVQSNYSTVAIISLSPNIPVNAFTFELLHALIQIDPALRLTKDYILEELGQDIFLKSNDFKLSDWLAKQEDKHRIVLYQCDETITDWTRLCIRHADVIFILVDPKGNH